jgi:glycerol-3-phosphate acyltransferase PlsY
LKLIVLNFIAVAVIGYLLGAIPFGIIISRLTANLDITRHGSGNIGGTNVMRILGLGPGALVMILDLAKAFASVIVARLIFTGGVTLFIGFPPLDNPMQSIAETTAALAAMAGHNWSVYIKFRGGKGVSSYFGSWLALFPLIALIGGVVTIITVVISRLMSRASMLGSIAAVCALMVLTIWYGVSPAYLIYSVLATGLIVYQHRTNIVRLQTGTEMKLDETVIKGQMSQKSNTGQGDK